MNILYTIIIYYQQKLFGRKFIDFYSYNNNIPVELTSYISAKYLQSTPNYVSVWFFSVKQDERVLVKGVVKDPNVLLGCPLWERHISLGIALAYILKVTAYKA